MGTPNRFMAARVCKKVKFMELEIEITKLTVEQVLIIREKSQAIKDEDSNANIDLLIYIIQAAALELSDLSEDEVKGFPMDELTKLSNEILQYSGLVNKK